MNFSFLHVYNLPILMRRWFVNRLMKQKKAENEARNNSQSG